MESGLKGRVALIAGASEGIGFATAMAFAREGAKVAMCSRSKEKITAAAAKIRAATTGEPLAEAVDVSDAVAIRRFVERTASAFGQVDIAVANAGGPPAKSFLEATDEDWRKALETNFLSVVHLARSALPYMRQKKWGRFIAITSTSVRQAIPDLMLSSTVRPAVVGLIKWLAMTYGADGITFNNVAPGYTATERLSELSGHRAKVAGLSEDDVRRRWAQEVPLRRLGKPEEIADAIVWLASDRASYVTGQTLLVDGGIYKGM